MDEKLTYEQIADRLNKMNYKTLKGKGFTKAIIYSMVKRRLKIVRKESVPKYSNFKVHFGKKSTID